jgi:hypothetical protein
MPVDRAAHELPTPLFEVLHAIGFGEHRNVNHFNTGTLFWSLTRLFGHYERVMAVLPLPYTQRPFLDSDLEAYIVRFRIVLNDIAYIVWQLLPQKLRGLKGPKGGTHPRNREVSIFDLVKSLSAHSNEYPELAAVFDTAVPWMARLKEDRDNVVHYKSQAVIFDTEPPSFALLNAAGTERTEPTSDGGRKLALIPIAEFVNGQLLSLYLLMHSELPGAIVAHAKRLGLRTLNAGWNSRMTCIGSARFKEVNGIGA